MKTRLLSALLALLCFYAHAQVGNPDPSFGKNGIQLLAGNTNNLAESAIKILHSPGGDFFMVINGGGGELTHISNALVVKYRGGGIIDTAFGTDGFSVPVTFIATDATLQADGKIVVVGYGPYNFPGAAFVIVRYNTDGKLDAAFSGDGIQLTNPYELNAKATGVVMEGDKIIVSGHFTDGQFKAARYLPDGSLDGDFGTGGIAATNFSELNYEAYTTGLVIQNDKIIVAGSFHGKFVLTRFNNDGTIDNNFNAAGKPGLMITSLGFATGDGAIASQADKIVVAGSSTDEFIVARFNHAGSLDNSFGVDGRTTAAFTNATAHDVIIYGDKIIVGGYAGAAFAIARFNDDGNLDLTFTGDGKLITGFPLADSARGLTLALQGNQLIMAGHVYFYNISTQKTQQDFAVAQYNSDGSPDNNFSGDGVLTAYFPNSSGEFRNAVVQRDGKIITVGHLRGASIVRYKKEGSLDSTFDGDGMQAVDMTWAASVRMQGDKIVVAGYSRTAAGAGNLSSLVVVRLNADGSLDTHFDTDGRVTLDLGPLGFTDLSPNALVIQDDKIIVVGTKAININSEAILIARFNSDGSLDQGFSQDGLATLQVGAYSGGTAVTLQGDKIVVAGYGGNGDIFLVARYNYDGSIDPSFGYQVTDISQSTHDRPLVIRIENDKIIVAGVGFMPATLNNMVAIARYNNDGSLDTGYDGDGKSLSAGLPGYLNMKSFSFDANGKLYVVISPIYTGGPYPASDTIYRFNQDGSRDINFKIVAPVAINNTIAGNNRLYALGKLYFPEFNNINSSFSKAAIAAYILEDNPTISFNCPTAKNISTATNKCTAIVTGIDPVFSPAGSTAAINYSLTGATTAQGAGSASGSTFNIGITTVTYSLAGNAKLSCSFTVTVQDNEPPVITNAFANPNILWPPNHKMRDVEIKYALSDNCKATAVLSVTSNEPQSGTDQQDVPGDWQIINKHTIKLRAERKGNGIGRIYTITITAMDQAGNKTSQNVHVRVPHTAPDFEKIKSKLTVKVAPNPASNYFNIFPESRDEQKISIKIFDSHGRIIDTRYNISPNRVIQLGHSWKPGFYYAACKQGDQEIIIKLVKVPGGW